MAVKERDASLAELEEVTDSSLAGLEEKTKRLILNEVHSVPVVPKLLRLVILDLNGILVYRAPARGRSTGVPRPRHRSANLKQGANYVYTRPYVSEFIDFLLDNFHVAIWSSAMERNVDQMVQLLLNQSQRSRLAFVWGQSYCVRVRPTNDELSKKPLFLKKLSRVYREPTFCDRYNQSNTLLVDDSPEKTTQNEPHTALHPEPYDPNDQDDHALSVSGKLYAWFERFRLWNGSTQDFVETHPLEAPQTAPTIPANPETSNRFL